MSALKDSGKVCARCGCVPLADGFTTGYGTNERGDILCFACCGVLDREAMIRDGKATLYLTGQGTSRAFGTEPAGYRAKVSNWPGTLEFPVGYVTRGHHNIARTRYDFDFRGPDGFWWHGVQYGDNTQIAHCRRTKQRIAS